MWEEAQQLSADAIIKEFEGLRLTAYVCSGNKLTIGYGHTKGVKPDMVITRAQAEKFLLDDLDEADRAIDKHVKVDLNINQRAALISWVFNLGEGYLIESTLLKKLNRMDYKGAANEMLKWVYAGGKRMRGLERRRKAERKLFLTPVVEKPVAVKMKQAAPMATAGIAAGAAVPEIINQVGAAAPAVSVARETAATAQENPMGLLIIILLAIIALGGFLAWRKINSLKEVRGE